MTAVLVKQCICGSRDVTETHVAQCREREQQTAATVAYVATLDRPLAEWPVRDLIAHLASHVQPNLARPRISVEVAAELARVVADLGWRPAFNPP